MRKIKSTLRDLDELFRHSITVRDIAEPLASFDESCAAETVREFMEKRNFDVVGVRREGRVVAVVTKGKSGSGSIGDYCQELLDSDELSESAPLFDLFELLKNRGWLVVNLLGHPNGIVTRADLQKIPVRMWLFSLVSLIELHAARLIQETFEDEAWKKLLPDDRIEKAIGVFNDRKKYNLEIDLLECLELSDKLNIVMRTETLFDTVCHMSKTKAKAFCGRLIRLRHDLAHGHDIAGKNWQKLVETACTAKTVLAQMEQA